MDMELHQPQDVEPLEMTFLDRLKNTVATCVAEYLMRNVVGFGMVDKLLDKHFPNEMRCDGDMAGFEVPILRAQIILC